MSGSDSSRAGGRVEISAGGIVFRTRDGRVEIVLGEQTDWNTRSRTTRLPKGHLEPGESLEEAAVREVREETGRCGSITARLDEIRYQYTNRRSGEIIDKRVVFFVMEDRGAHPGPDTRDDEMERVFWLPIEDAAARLSFEVERTLVEQAAALLAKHPPSA